ncbi:hypothetical protein DM01DRAFT_1340165 [Hesseltinella vesiculosa]|uniref:C2H2-type domain-containing protein n=1 Tax=Hesseltinella vesiculosa TaxID=101127 RepID=A0A1X2G4U0_9FUNG|nr:hypothetical protein DM01DRAFT_1340165 [Hesseltinella vesiculosa]
MNNKQDANMSATLSNRLILSLLEQPSPFLHSVAPSPAMSTPCLDTFSTPFTPAAAGFLTTDSPMMSTPFMDPLMTQYATPFLDASATPFMDANDGFEQYFTPMMTPSLALHDVASLDPSTLLTQTNIQAQVPANDDDSLFPPLTQEQEQQKVVASSGLGSDVTDFDGLFDDLFAEVDAFPSNDVQQSSAKGKPSKKRKRDGDDQVQAILKLARLDENQQYVCPLCDRTFRRRYNLGTHIRTHNKERLRPYPCDMCPKTFDRKHDCARHISTVHMGERAFRCGPCKVAFSRRDALHRHQLQKHAG